MKLRTILLFPGGFVSGLAVTLALLLLNPFTPQAKPVKPITAVEDGHVVERFLIEAPADIVAITHNGKNIINPTPPGIPTFTEPGLQTGLVLVAKLRNAAGEIVGFALESEAIESSTNLMLGKLRMNTDWTLVLPGRGTIFAYQIEDGGAVGMEIIPTVMTGGEWNGSVEFVSTAGPHSTGRGIVAGGSGEFSGVTGTFVERTRLRQMSRTRGGVGTFELEISYKR